MKTLARIGVPVALLLGAAAATVPAALAGDRPHYRTFAARSTVLTPVDGTSGASATVTCSGLGGYWVNWSVPSEESSSLWINFYGPPPQTTGTRPLKDAVEDFFEAVDGLITGTYYTEKLVAGAPVRMQMEKPGSKTYSLEGTVPTC